MLNYDSFDVDKCRNNYQTLINLLENDENVVKTTVNEHITNYEFCNKYNDAIFFVELYSQNPELPIVLYEVAHPYDIYEERRSINLVIGDNYLACKASTYTFFNEKAKNCWGHLSDFNLYLDKFIKYARNTRPNEW